MGIVQFVRNYSDLSTDSGFQFEFFCDRCGSGYQTDFVSSNTGAFDLLNVAGNFFGGVVGAVASLGENARSAAWKKARDDAFRQAIQAAKPHFNQCRRCGQWIDAICWNAAKNLCKECAPELDSELDSSESRVAVERAEEALREGKNVKKPATSKKKSAPSSKAKPMACAGCGAQVGNAKFCPECGTPVARKMHCAQCGAESPGKFCPECGAKQ